MITVEDTTPPELTAPCDLSIQSSSPIAATDPAIAPFLTGATATDIVSPSPKLENDAPTTFPLGTTTVTFTATDDFGNKVSKAATVTIGPDAVGSACELDRLPPGNVRSVKASTGNLSVTISWKPPTDADFDHVEISRSTGAAARGRTVLALQDTKVVYDGKGTKYVDRRLKASTQYRYVIVSVDKAGNRAAGVAVIALAQRQAILSPTSGAVVRHPPRVSWRKTKGASYYNMQVWLAGAKILSVWPSGNAYQMKANWKFGKSFRALKPGKTYTIYVWPGFGNRKAAKYGALIVQSTFRYKR